MRTSPSTRRRPTPSLPQNEISYGLSAARRLRSTGQPSVQKARSDGRFSRSLPVGLENDMAPDAKQRTEILKSIKKRVLANHINVAGIDYGVWAQHVDERTPELLTCEVREFEDGVRQLLAELKTSHTVFYHSLPKELLPQHTINASLRDVCI